MSQPNNINNPDLKDTKIFVGGLAWRTTTDDLRRYFQQLGEVLDANVVSETCPGGRSKSKGYGFVTFRDAESAARACEPPYPIIDGRQTNINLAYLRAKNNINHSNQNGLLHQAGSSHQYQNGSLNHTALHQYQPNLQYIYPQFPPVYWDPNYGQYHYMYNVPYYPCHTPMIYHYVSPYGMQQNWQQRNISRPVRISAPPQRSLAQIENVDETNQEVDFVHKDTKEETVTESDSDVDQQKAKDEEGESIGQDNDIKQDVEYQEGKINENKDGIEQGEEINDIKQDVEDREVEIMSGQDNIWKYHLYFDEGQDLIRS